MSKGKEYNHRIDWATLNPVNGNYAPKSYLPTTIKQQKQQTAINQDNKKKLWLTDQLCGKILELE